MKKLSSILLALLLVFSFSVANVSADNEDEGTEGATPPVTEGGGEDEVGVPPEENETDIFDADALTAFLAEGLKQGDRLYLADFYTGDEDFEAIDNMFTLTNITGEVTKLDEDYFLFPQAGTITFTVTDGENTWGPFTVEVAANPVTGLTFDKSDVTVEVGKSVEIYFETIPEDGYLEDSLSLTWSAEGTGDAVIEGIVDPNNEDGESYIIGYRITALEAGTFTLTVNATTLTRRTYTPAVATITMVNAPTKVVTPNDTITPATNVVATGDNTLANTYALTAVLSLAALGYIVYMNKRSAISK